MDDMANLREGLNRFFDLNDSYGMDDLVVDVMKASETCEPLERILEEYESHVELAGGISPEDDRIFVTAVVEFMKGA